MLCQLLPRQSRAKIGIPLPHDRQRQGAHLSGEPMVAGSASALGKQARGTVLPEATQQTKHLTPLQADQHTGVSNTQTTRLNSQQHLKPAELLLAHRQHRQGAPPGTPEPGGVSPLSCRGVSSLYCAYSVCAPSGGNMQRWRFLVIRDPKIKKTVWTYYKRAWDEQV